jgi:hypothetical protein
MLAHRLTEKYKEKVPTSKQFKPVRTKAICSIGASYSLDDSTSNEVKLHNETDMPLLPALCLVSNVNIYFEN